MQVPLSPSQLCSIKKGTEGRLFQFFLPNTKLPTETKMQKENQQGGLVKVGRGTGLTLVSNKRASLVVVKRQRTMSRVGKLGREMATSRERVKAQRRTMPGTK